MSGSGSVRPQQLFSTDEGGAAMDGQQAVQEEGEMAGSVETESETEKEDRIDKEQEASRQPQLTRAPAAPTQKQKDAHYPLHVKFEAWCPECVAGQGVSDHHKASIEENGGNLGTTISMDYCFMTNEDKEDDTPQC